MIQHQRSVSAEVLVDAAAIGSSVSAGDPFNDLDVDIEVRGPDAATIIDTIEVEVYAESPADTLHPHRPARLLCACRRGDRVLLRRDGHQL